MAAGDEQDLIEAVVTCEGNLHDPDFQDRFRCLVAKLKSALYISKTKDPFRVRKIEPWNSVRVTISIPKDAAQRLIALAQENSQNLRQIGILSIQVEGDQVIALTLADGENETTEALIRQTNAEAASSSGTSGVSSSSLPASSPSISSISSSVASISSPVPLPLTPGPSGEASGIAVTLDMLSSSPSTLTSFRSPNVVAPSGEAIPVLPPKTPSMGVHPALGGPFPFVSMAHAAQAIQRNELSPVLSCNNVVVSNSNFSSSNAANSTNSIASSSPSSSLFQGAIKSVQPPQMHLPSTAISNNPPSGTPVIVSTSVVTAVSESYVTRLIIEKPSSSSLNLATQMVGGNVASLGISGNNLANSQAGPSQSLQRQLVNVPPPYPGVNTINTKHSLSSSSSNPSGILTSNVQVRHSQQQASLLSNVSGSSPSPNSNLPTIRMVTSVAESHALLEKTAGGIINNEVPCVAPIADISDSTSGISSLAQPVASPLLVNLLQNNDVPSGSSSSSTSANTDAYNQQLMQKTSNVPSRVVTASSDKLQGRYLIQQQQSKKTKRGLSMDGACSSVPKSVPVCSSVSGSDSIFPVTVPQATSGTDSFQFALPLPSENTSSVTMNRVSVPITPQNKIGGPLLSNQKGTEQTSAAVLHGRTIMQGNIRILDQGSGQIRTISLQHQQHPPPPPYSAMTSAHGKAVLPGGSIRTHGQPSLRPELVTSATLTNGPLHASLSELSDGGEIAKSQTTTPVTLVQSGEHQMMDQDASKTAMTTAALVADQSRTLLPITTVNIVSKSASKPSSVNFNSSKDSDAKTFIPPPDPRMSSQVQRMSQSGSNPVSVKNSASNLVVQTTSCNTDAKSSTSQLNSVGRKRSSKDRIFPISQIPPSGKPRQFLINPLTGHLEPMPCESSSESEEGDDGEGEGGRKSNSHKSSALKNKSSRGPALLPSVHHRQIVTTESGVTVARVVKGPLLLDPSTAQSHRELDGRKPTNNSGDSSIASSGASIMSVTKKSREDSFTNVALYNQKDAKESSIPSPATVTATSVSGEKIKLRLKLEKSEPISPAYKVDVSFVKKSEKGAFLPNISSGSSGPGTPSSSATFSSSLSGNQSSSGDQPRVPPLHISLRGKNAAVVVSPRREEKDMPPPPPVVGGNTKDPLVNIIAKDVATLETSSGISSLPSHSKSTSHMLNSHEGKSSNSSKSSGIVKRAKGRVKSLDGTSISSKGLTGEKTKVKASRPKLSKEVSLQDTLTAAKNQEAAKQPLYQFPMPELQPVTGVPTTPTPSIAMPSAKETQGFEKTTTSAALSHPITTVSPVEIIPSNNNNKCLEDELSLPAEPSSESCATSFLPSSNSAPDLIAEKEGRTGSQEESAKINSVIEDVILSKSKENMEREAPIVAFPVASKTNSPVPPQLELEKNSSHSVTEESPLPQIDDVLKGAFSSSETPPSDIYGESLEEKLLPDSVEPAAVIPLAESNSISKIDLMDPVINPAVDSCDNNSDFGEPSQNSDKLDSKITEEVSVVNLKETTSPGATNLNRDEQRDESKSSEESKDDNGVVATIPEELPSASLMEVVEDKTTEEMDISTDIVNEEGSTSNKCADLEELPTVKSTEESSGNDMMEVEENGGKLEEEIAVIEEAATSLVASAHPEDLIVDYGSRSNTDSEAIIVLDGVSSSSPLSSTEKLTDLPCPQKIEQLLEKEESPKPSGDENFDADQNSSCMKQEHENEPEADKVAAHVSTDITTLDDKTDCNSKLENDNVEAASVPEIEPDPSSRSAQDDLAALSKEETPESKLQLVLDKIENDQDKLSNFTHQETQQEEIGGERSVEEKLINDEIFEGEAKASTLLEDIGSPPKLVDSTELPVESLTLKKSVESVESSVCEKSSESHDVPVKDIIEKEEVDPTLQPDKPVMGNQIEEESIEQGNNDPAEENNLIIQSCSKDSITVAQAQPEELIDTNVVDFKTKAEIVLDDTKEHKVEEERTVDEIPQHQELAGKEAPSVNDIDIAEQKVHTGTEKEVMGSPKPSTSPSAPETNVEKVETVPTIQNACDATVNEELSITEESSECGMEESNLTEVNTTDATVVVQGDDDTLVDQPLKSLKKNDDNNMDTIRIDSVLSVETIPEELSKKDAPAESSNKCTKSDEEKEEETPSETVTSPVLSVPKLSETATEEKKPSLIPVSDSVESADEDDYNTSNTTPDDDDDPSVSVTIMTPKNTDTPVASSTTSAPPISIVLPSNNPDGKAGTSKNAYKRRAEIKPGALQNTLKRLHGNFLPKVLKTSDTQDVTSQRTEEADCVDEPPVQVVEPVKAMIPITPNKVAVSYATVTQSPVSITVSQVRPIMTNVIHRPKVSSTSVPSTTTQPTLHQISSGLHSNILANVSVALTSSTLTSVTSISVPSTSSGSGPQTVFAIHPNVSIPANFAQLQQSPVVLPGGHKMVPIKLVTLPKQSGGQLQTIPLGNATPNRSSPNLLEAVNIVANAGSRSSSPKTTLISNAMQSTPLNLSSMSLPVGGNLHFVPISVSSATGTTSNVKVLMTQPIKMQQAGLSQSMVVKSVLMGNQPTTIRVIRPSNLQEPISFQTLMKPSAEQTNVTEISLPKANVSTPETLGFKRDFIVQPESLFKKLDGVEIVETGSPLNNDELPFEADIIHDEKDLADVLASEAKSEMIPMENCANFNISLQNDIKAVEKGPKAKVNTPSASATSSIPVLNHVTSKSLLQINRDAKSAQGSPLPATKRSSPVFTYSSSSAKSSRNRNSPSRTPSPLNPVVPDLHGEDQEIINSFSGAPSLSRLTVQTKSQARDSLERKAIPSSEMLPDHTYGITTGISITNCSSSNNIDEVLSIEIPPIDLEVAATLSPSQNATEEKRCTRSTRSNPRLSPDITAFVSETQKSAKLSTKAEPLFLKNSPKPSPTGSLKILSPTPSSLTITPSTSTRSSPILNSQHQINASNAAATINAVALGIIDKIQGNATAQNAKNSRISKLSGANKRKRQESDSSSASRDENNEEKAEIDLNSRPGKRKCSENAAEMIKVCIGVEDSPKRNSTSIKKTDDGKSKESKGKKGMGTVVEEDDDADSEVSLSRGRSGRSSRESSEDRSSSRGSSVHRVVSSTATDKPKQGKEEEPAKDTKSSRLNSRLNKDGRPKLKSQSDKASPQQSSIPSKNAKESGQVTTRRLNRPNSKNKSPLTPAKTRTNVRKDAISSNANLDKTATATPSSNANPESENARRKTRSSAAGKRHTT